MSDPLGVLAGGERPAWLVGGALRDRLLGRPTDDYDVAVEGDPRSIAKDLARGAGGHAFELSHGFGAWRVIARDRAWQVDVLGVQGGTIEADLAMRDLSINAIAQPLPDGPLIDPFDGVADLERRRLRMVSADAFGSDPLRVLRLARLACELDFEVDPATATAARAQADGLGRVAPERIFAELKRIVCSDRALDGLALMSELSITERVLPELDRLRGVEQSRFHHLDVHAHTLAVLAEAISLEQDPAVLGADADAVDAFMSAPLANDLTRWQAMRFGALLHDIAKPQTRQVGAEGRVTFMGHDTAGSDTARDLLSRLRASERLAAHVAALARHHLRLGFLVHEAPVSRRAIYGYLHACGEVGVDVTVLSVADRLATRGDRAEEAIAKHLELARSMLGEALAWAADPPRPPLRGDELARELGISPGPALGRILAELEQASFADEIASRADAIERARELAREAR